MPYQYRPLMKNRGWKNKFYQQITTLSEEELRRAVLGLERIIIRLQDEIHIHQKIKGIYERRLREIQQEGRMS